MIKEEGSQKQEAEQTGKVNNNYSEEDEDSENFSLDTFEPVISPSESSQKSILETLAKNSSQDLIEFADKAEEIIYNFSCAKEEHDYNLNQSREKTKRLIIIAGVFLVIAGFIDSGFTGDKELPQKLINITLAALGGIGGYKLFTKEE